MPPSFGYEEGMWESRDFWPVLHTFMEWLSPLVEQIVGKPVHLEGMDLKCSDGEDITLLWNKTTGVYSPNHMLEGETNVK